MLCIKLSFIDITLMQTGSLLRSGGVKRSRDLRFDKNSDIVAI